MEPWQIWMAVGVVMVFLEFIVPGGIIVFLGMAAALVGLGVYLEWIPNLAVAFLCWFILSLFFLLVLRSLSIMYFEGDSRIENVDEDLDIRGSLVDVIEPIFPHKDGRVKFRDATWTARSDDELVVGAKAVIENREGNCLVVKPI